MSPLSGSGTAVKGTAEKKPLTLCRGTRSMAVVIYSLERFSCMPDTVLSALYNEVFNLNESLQMDSTHFTDYKINTQRG